MDKVMIFCDHSKTMWEMTDILLTSGSFWPPSASFRINRLHHCLLSMHSNKTLSKKKEKKYATTFFCEIATIPILRSSSSYFLFNYFCPLITSCCLLHFFKDQSEAKLKWQMTPIFFAFVSYIRKLVEEWHWGYS